MSSITIHNLSMAQVDEVLEAIHPFVRSYEVASDSGAVTYVTVG